MTDLSRIPRAALFLGYAGLLPFLWGAATDVFPGLAVWAGEYLPPMFLGTYLGLIYGTVILAFMAGALWGFAARGEGRAFSYILAVTPALWAFFMVIDATMNSTIYLIAGFIGLLFIDATFVAQGLASRWWMRQPLPLTLGVVVCQGLPMVA